jgi:hypothetical protein
MDGFITVISGLNLQLFTRIQLPTSYGRPFNPGGLRSVIVISTVLIIMIFQCKSTRATFFPRGCIQG